MANYARIIDNVAVEVSADPAGQFHPSIAAEFVAVPDQVRAGWRKVGGLWVEPAPLPAATAPKAPRHVTVAAYFRRFTSEERIAIIDRQAGDGNVRDFVFLANASKFIDLDDDAVGLGLAYLVHIGLLTQARAAEILAGEVIDAERP